MWGVREILLWVGRIIEIGVIGEGGVGGGEGEIGEFFEGGLR